MFECLCAKPLSGQTESVTDGAGESHMVEFENLNASPEICGHWGLNLSLVRPEVSLIAMLWALHSKVFPKVEYTFDRSVKLRYRYSADVEIKANLCGIAFTKALLLTGSGSGIKADLGVGSFSDD